MNIRYLIDENLDPLYKTQLVAKKPTLIIYAVGDPGMPAKEPLIQKFYAGAKKMNVYLSPKIANLLPPHLGAHLAHGCHIPGIITLNTEMSIGDTIEELLLIAEIGIVSDYKDRIEYLPVT